MVKKEQTIRELAAVKEHLLQSLRLFDLAASAHAPDFLKRIDLPAMKELLGETDLPRGEEGLLYPDSGKLLAAIRKSEEGQKLLLSSDVDLLKQVSETGKDQVHKGPLGFFEAVFPVKVRGQVVHCLWSGKFREQPFASEEITEVARLAGVSRAEAEELAKAVPVLSKKQVDRAMAFCGRFRGALEQAMTHQLHSAELTQQLVQSERTHSVGTLSGGVAHHFNNLLSVILGYSSFVLNREQVSDEAADALHKIAEAAQRGRRLTEEILAFLGSEVEEEAPCDVHETVNNVLSLLESKTGTQCARGDASGREGIHRARAAELDPPDRIQSSDERHRQHAVRRCADRIHREHAHGHGGGPPGVFPARSGRQQRRFAGRNPAGRSRQGRSGCACRRRPDRLQAFQRLWNGRPTRWHRACFFGARHIDARPGSSADRERPARRSRRRRRPAAASRRAASGWWTTTRFSARCAGRFCLTKDTPWTKWPAAVSFRRSGARAARSPT